MPHGDGVGDFVFDGHELHFALATPMSAEVEAYGCDAFFGEGSGDGGHWGEVFA